MVDGVVVVCVKDITVIVAGGNVADEDNPNNLVQFNGFRVSEKEL